MQRGAAEEPPRIDLHAPVYQGPDESRIMGACGEVDRPVVANCLGVQETAAQVRLVGEHGVREVVFEDLWCRLSWLVNLDVKHR